MRPPFDEGENLPTAPVEPIDPRALIPEDIRNQTQSANGWPRFPLRYRFLLRVEKNPETGCWDWTGNVDRLGYGRLSNKKGSTFAHRIAFEIFFGPIPDGRELDHVCRNRACANPWHLRLATHSENLRNTVAKANSKSGLKGVSWHKVSGKWAARIMVNRKMISLGYFHDPLEAHRAYCDAAKTVHGEFSNTGTAHLDQLELRKAIPAFLAGGKGPRTLPIEK